MLSYKKIPLGEVASYINGYAFKPVDWGKNGLPIIRIQNLTDENKEFNYYEGNFDKKYLIKRGDILISWSASLGVYEWNKNDAILNQHIFKVVFDKIQVDKKYYFFALKKILKEAIKNTHGSTMKHITRPQFEKILFPFYELEKQKKIAKILENISNIIEKKKEKLQEYELLSKCLFFRVITRAKASKKEDLAKNWKEIFNVRTGKLDSNAMIENGKYPFFTCAKEAFRINDYAFDCEALLLAGNNAAGIYDVKYYKGKFNAYQRTYVLELKNKEWHYKFFKQQLEEKLFYLKYHSKGTNTRYLTLEILNKLNFIIPSLQEQQKYENYITKIEKSKFSLLNFLKI